MPHNHTQTYEQEVKFGVNLSNMPIDVITKPGLPDWNHLLPATELLAQSSEVRPSDRVLLMGSHHGALGVFLAHQLQGGNLTITDNHFLALEMTHKTLQENHCLEYVNIVRGIHLPVSDDQSYDEIFIHLTKSRPLMRRWLVQAFHSLRNRGSLFLAGQNKAGIQPAIKDAKDLFGNGQILAYKKGNRVARFIKDVNHLFLPDWVNVPGCSRGSWVEFKVDISGLQFNIRSLPGVFSFDHLDQGTKMLLEEVNFYLNARVLDVGCGYGIIGMYAAKKGATSIDLIDNDLLAVASSQETLNINGIANTVVYPGDLLSPVTERQYDLILSNPPFHAGHAVDYEMTAAMIRQSHQALSQGGRLVIVANRFLTYDQLIRKEFGNMTRLSESGKFHVLSGLKST